MRNCTAGAAHSTPGTVQEGKLAEDQIKELENLGFELLSFKEEGGHCNVRGPIRAAVSAGGWSSSAP